MVRVAVGSTPSTFDTPETKTAATPVRAEKTGADDLPSANDDQPTHNPEPDAAASKLNMKPYSVSRDSSYFL